MTLNRDALATAAGWLRKAGRVLVFTGAGVSAESGIPTFRDAGGLWDEFDPDTFATASGLARVAATNPGELARFFHGLLQPIADAEPNPAHRAIAELEKTHEVVVATQNVDGLHQEAGSDEVHEIHGSLMTIVGADRQRLRTLSRRQLREITERLERAQRGWFRHARIFRALSPLLGLGEGLVHRPTIVMFGEPLREPDWTLAQEAATRAHVVLSVGTSGDVWPANQLPVEASRRGAKVIGVGPVELSADLWLEGKAGDVLPELVQLQGDDA